MTRQGCSGNNTDLKSQTNVGIDNGVDWTPNKWIKLIVTGILRVLPQRVRHPIAGSRAQNFTTNIPHSTIAASKLRSIGAVSGLEVDCSLHHNDQFYREYTEQLECRRADPQFDRGRQQNSGRVAPRAVATRLGYDQPVRTLEGLGWFVEYVWKDGFFMENANLLKAPAYRW